MPYLPHILLFANIVLALLSFRATILTGIDESPFWAALCLFPLIGPVVLVWLIAYTRWQKN